MTSIDTLNAFYAALAQTKKSWQEKLFKGYLYSLGVIFPLGAWLFMTLHLLQFKLTRLLAASATLIVLASVMGLFAKVILDLYIKTHAQKSLIEHYRRFFANSSSNSLPFIGFLKNLLTLMTLHDVTSQNIVFTLEINSKKMAYLKTQGVIFTALIVMAFIALSIVSPIHLIAGYYLLGTFPLFAYLIVKLNLKCAILRKYQKMNAFLLVLIEDAAYLQNNSHLLT